MNAANERPSHRFEGDADPFFEPRGLLPACVFVGFSASDAGVKSRNGSSFLLIDKESATSMPTSDSGSQYVREPTIRCKQKAKRLQERGCKKEAQKVSELGSMRCPMVLNPTSMSNNYAAPQASGLDVTRAVKLY